MYGETVIIHNIFRRTSKEVVDYAADAQGVYEGWMNYGKQYISDTNRGDSIPVKISVRKNNWGNIAVQYENIDVLGTRRNVSVDSIQATRYFDERRFILDEGIGTNMLFINPDSIYNIRSEGYQGQMNKDSIYFTLDFSKVEFLNPNNPSAGYTERYYQYQRFRGKRNP